MSEVVHRCPVGSSNVMPCCGMTPWDRLADRMTIEPELVTCVPAPSPTEAIVLDVDLLESRLRVARLMASGPLTDEAGA